MTFDDRDSRLDDDRLLDLALGIDDDPDLAAAVAASPELVERLGRLSADIDAVRDEVHRSIPAPPDDYADPGAGRWNRLRPYFAPPQEAARRPRHSRQRLAWVLGPVLGLALAFAVVVAVQPATERQTQETQLVPKGRFSAEGSAPAPTPVDGAGSVAGQSQTDQSYGRSAVLTAASGFKTVVVATAGPVSDGVQNLVVTRVLKGDASASLKLHVKTPASPLPMGTEIVVYLDPHSPAAIAKAVPASGLGAGGGGTPPGVMPPPVSGYRAGGGEALVQVVPSGIDANALTVP